MAVALIPAENANVWALRSVVPVYALRVDRVRVTLSAALLSTVAPIPTVETGPLTYMPGTIAGLAAARVTVLLA